MTAEEFIEKKNSQFKINSVIKVKDIGRKGTCFFVREAWTFLVQSNLSEKVFIIERLRKELTKGKIIHQSSWNKGDIEYRIGYFIIGKIGKTRERWVWGQFCPLIPHQDLISLLDKAKKDGTIK